VERQFQVVERQTQVAERRSGPFRLNLTTVKFFLLRQTYKVFACNKYSANENSALMW